MSGGTGAMAAGADRVPVIAAVGDNTIDRYVGDESVHFAGGNAFNVAAQIATHGGSSAYFGAVGRDANARVITSALRRAGVDPVGLVTMPGPTAITTIRVDGGERSFESEEFGVTADYFPSDSHVALLSRARWVHVGMLPDSDELRYRLARLRAGRDGAGRDGAGPVISQDCAVSTGFADLDVAFGSVGEDGDARAWSDVALAGGARFAIVTRGASGGLATDGSSWFEWDAVPADVVDTTGAGDAFIAGYLSARSAGSAQRSALGRGAVWAAEACGHRGGWRGAGGDRSAPRRVSVAPPSLGG